MYTSDSQTPGRDQNYGHKSVPEGRCKFFGKDKGKSMKFSPIVKEKTEKPKTEQNMRQ